MDTQDVAVLGQPRNMTRLEASRRQAGLSQRALARRAKVPQPSISLFETRKAVPVGVQAERLARALDIQPADLLEG